MKINPKAFSAAVANTQARFERQTRDACRCGGIPIPPSRFGGSILFELGRAIEYASVQLGLNVRGKYYDDTPSLLVHPRAPLSGVTRDTAQPDALLEIVFDRVDDTKFAFLIPDSKNPQGEASVPLVELEVDNLYLENHQILALVVHVDEKLAYAVPGVPGVSQSGGEKPPAPEA